MGTGLQRPAVSAAFAFVILVKSYCAPIERSAPIGWAPLAIQLAVDYPGSPASAATFPWEMLVD
jgi:hypothetical protein